MKSSQLLGRSTQIPTGAVPPDQTGGLPQTSKFCPQKKFLVMLLSEAVLAFYAVNWIMPHFSVTFSYSTFSSQLKRAICSHHRSVVNSK